MLNRLYIVIGVLAILMIAAAFIVPRFIQWGDYRGRMQVIAAEVLGAPVEIAGDIEFSLLPQPRLVLADVNVGDPAAPSLKVAAVEAEFSLLDFLRDRYRITRLVLDSPVFAVRVDMDGAFVSGIAVPEQVSTGNVAVAAAQVINGSATLADARSGTTVAFSDVSGEVRLEALRGPFGFRGRGTYEGRVFDARIATSELDADDASQLSIYLEPADKAFALTAEGTLAAGGKPAFNGAASLRIRPPPPVEGEPVDLGRGDLVLSSQIEANPNRMLLSDYTIVPDENRAAARLTGAAEVTLGARRSFQAVISGGVLALPPRDATEDQSQVPYELVRLLDDVPVPFLAGIAGTVHLDIAEFNLRAFALRNLRLDATTDGRSWTVETFAAQLPGSARLSLAGTLSVADGRPNFAGEVEVETERLDALAQTWRRVSPGAPLFNVPGSFRARLALVGETLSISEGVLTIAGQGHRMEAELGFEPATRHLNLRADLGTLDRAQSEALLALLPDVADDMQFGATFPRGQFHVAADAATLGGLAGRDLEAGGFWEGGVLAFETLSAGDLGGVALDARVTAFGSVAKPEFSGTLRLAAADGDSPALEAFYDFVATPPPLRAWLAKWTPAEVMLELGAPTGEGGQSLTVTGRAATSDVKLTAELGVGISQALAGPISLRVDVNADDPAALTSQLGLGDVSLTPEGAPMHVVAVLSGTAANSFETTVRVEGGGEHLAFAGNVISADLSRITGNGNVQVALSDVAGLAERLGASGLWVPEISGGARIDFDGLNRMRLTGISASSGGEPISGQLEWEQDAGGASITGTLQLGRVSPLAVLSFLGGPASTLSSGDGLWAHGPLDTGQTRTTTGRISVSAASLALGGDVAVEDASFELGWGAEDVRVRNFRGQIGGGMVSADVGICCAGPLPTKQVTARISLRDAAIGRTMPRSIGDAIAGTLDASARLSGTGDSLASLMDAMAGEGTYTLSGLTIENLNPAAFDAIATLDAVLELEPVAVRQMVTDELAKSNFAVTTDATGSFTIASGVLRSANLALDGDTALLFGSSSMRLSDLGLGGSFAMSPKEPSGPGGLLTEGNAQIVVNLEGTLLDPRATFDVAGMVDAIMVKAFEVEVARLEQIRAEEEARVRAAAEERARIAAEEEARRLAEEEAARRAAEEEAARIAAEEEAAQPPAPLQPGFNLNPTESPNLF